MAAPFKVQRMIGTILQVPQAILFELTVIILEIHQRHPQKFVYVNLSNSKISKIDRVHTWITSKSSYASIQGSNNVIRWPGQDMEFEVYLRMQGISVEDAQNADIILYYEVEGTCA